MDSPKKRISHTRISDFPRTVAIEALDLKNGNLVHYLGGQIGKSRTGETKYNLVIGLSLRPALS